MFGPALVVVPLAFTGLRRVRHLLLPIAAFCLLYLGFHLLYIVRFERFMMALTGALAVLAAVGLQQVLRRLPQVRTAGVALVVVALLGPAVMAATAVSRVVADPHGEARDWIAENVPQGASVAVDGFGTWVDPTRYDVHPRRELIDSPVQEYRDLGVTHLVSARSQFDRYDRDRYPRQHAEQARLVAETCEVASFGGGRRAVVVFAMGPC
jgi:hypothetical protein